jgi:hypothetical protein
MQFRKKGVASLVIVLSFPDDRLKFHDKSLVPGYESPQRYV